MPVIVPVVVYHGTATWRVSRQFADELTILSGANVVSRSNYCPRVAGRSGG
ncbi:Rpn family recombination-promoting nuclease/putative transposase [Candidatus Accumulibacter aalborgensis]|uniref:Rpn family recombination-promoting nuclease/putative transposase n=1 Tax=Candidatus Accumulibacter aalborgensis TaxID=1860102 RepID=UPI0016461F03